MVYNNKFPFFIYSTAFQRKPWSARLVIYTYSRFAFLSLQFFIQFSTDCILPSFYPCLRFFERSRFGVDDPSIAAGQYLPTNYTTYPQHYTTTDFPSIQECFVRPVYPGRLLHCNFAIGDQYRVLPSLFEIHYYPPDPSPKQPCPGYLEYTAGNPGSEVRLTNTKTVRLVKGNYLIVNFSQGCRWYGGSFFISRKPSSSAVFTLSKAMPYISLPALPFHVTLPLKQGFYTVSRLAEFITYRASLDYYNLDFSSNCSLGKPWGNVRVAEMIVIKHMNQVSIL